MKAKIFCFIVSLFLLSFAFSETQTGLGSAVNESTVASLIKFMSPEIIKQVSSIKIPDQSFTVKAGILKIKISLSEIGIQINNFSPEIVNVNFESPDIIHVTITDLKAKGGFKGKLKWSFISNTEKVDFDFKSVNINMKIKILTRDVEGKKLPNGSFELFNLQYDFDFTFHGSLAKILKLVKKPIKKAITKAVNNIVQNQSTTLLQKAFAMVPPYVSINDKGYAVDYTFVTTPTIKENFLLFNSFGAFVNTKMPDTMTQHFPLSENVPEYNPGGKQVQLYVSEYVFNTAFYTLYHSNSLNMTIKPEVIPASVPVKLNTNWLSTIIWGLDKTFGKDLLCEVGLAVRDSPLIDFTEKFIQLILPTEITINVRMNETNSTDNYELKQAVKIHSDFIVDLDFHIMEQGNITAHIHQLKMNSTSLNESVVPTASAQIIEAEFNMVTSLLIPSLNNYLEQFLNITIPSVKGIKFNDMTVGHFTNYVTVEYNLTYENVTTITTELFDIEELENINEIVKCPEGKIIKKMKLKTTPEGKMYYKVKCANRDYYRNDKKKYVCPNDNN